MHTRNSWEYLKSTNPGYTKVFSAAIAHAMEFEKGEVIEWVIEDKGLLALQRKKVPLSSPKSRSSSRLEESRMAISPASINQDLAKRSRRNSGHNSYATL